MKRVRTLRAAAVLLVATMLSGSFVGGTFAKYTTSDDGSDSARVAKWGVTAVVSGDLFGKNYLKADDNTISATFEGTTVGSSGQSDKLVAPGTKTDTGVTVAISGTPEVANTVTFANTAESNKDIYLKAGAYGTMVAAAGVTADNFAGGTYYTLASGTYTKATSFAAETDYYTVRDAVTLAADYYPVVWTVDGLQADGEAAQTYTSVSAMLTALSTGFTSGESGNAAGAAIDKSCTIKWAWAFETNNGADTILGNIIAADTDAVAVKTTDDGATYAAPAATTDYSTDVALNYTITVTQVD